MVKAAEIRKRVREAEAKRVKARADAAIQVAESHHQVAAARAALTAAEGDLRKSVRAALTSHGYSVTELAGVTDVPASALRSVDPDGTRAGANGTAPDGDESPSNG